MKIKKDTRNLYISRDLGSKNCFITTEEPTPYSGTWTIKRPSMDTFTYISDKMLERLGIRLEEGTMAKVSMRTQMYKVDLNGNILDVDK